MKKFLTPLCLMLALAACDGMSDDLSRYQSDPHMRTVNVDDFRIFVTPDGNHQYVAWGGNNARDTMVQYRQRRAIELVSKCHVSKILTRKDQNYVRAIVKC